MNTEGWNLPARVRSMRRIARGQVELAGGHETLDSKFVGSPVQTVLIVYRTADDREEGWPYPQPPGWATQIEQRPKQNGVVQSRWLAGW